MVHVVSMISRLKASHHCTDENTGELKKSTSAPWRFKISLLARVLYYECSRHGVDIVPIKSVKSDLMWFSYFVAVLGGP